MKKFLIGFISFCCATLVLMIIALIIFHMIPLDKNNNSSISSVLNSSQEDNTLCLKNNPEIATAFIDFIKYGGEWGDVGFSRYCIYDINNDGCEELILIAGSCEAEAELIICQYINNKAQEIGRVSGSHCSVCGIADNTGIIIHYGIQGVETIYMANISNNNLITKEIIPTREVDSYTEFDYCRPLTFFQRNDINILKSYGGTDKYESLYSSTYAPSYDTPNYNNSHINSTAPQLSVGMTKSQVRAKWGEPIQIEKSTSKRGTMETWWYKINGNSVAVNFDVDGKVWLINE